MKIAELPSDEEFRLQSLAALEILDSTGDRDYDDLVTLVAQITGCPIVVIGFMDRHRQWVKAACGMEDAELSRDVSICSHSILVKEGLTIKDLSKHPSFFDNPIVTSGLCLRSYAGKNIVSPNGQIVGTLCVADTKPRNFSQNQLTALEAVARQISLLLEARLNNIMLQKRADQMIKLEKELVQNSLFNHENDRQQIGYQLHEGIAQTLAACNNFLSLAENDSPLQKSLIFKTREELGKLLAEVRESSRQYTPTTLQDFCLADMLAELIQSHGQKFGFKTSFILRGNRCLASRAQKLAILRNLQEYFSILIGSGKPSSVTIRLTISETIEMVIIDNGRPIREKEMVVDIFYRTIINRAQAFDGELLYKCFSKNGNALKMSFPHIDAAASNATA